MQVTIPKINIVLCISAWAAMVSGGFRTRDLFDFNMNRGLVWLQESDLCLQALYTKGRARWGTEGPTGVPLELSCSYLFHICLLWGKIKYFLQ